MDSSIYNIKLSAALDETNIYLAFYRLKNIELPAKLDLKDAILLRLANFNEKYTEHEHFFKTDFHEFMACFIKKIEPTNIDLLVQLLSFIENIDLEYYRSLFSYSKIYITFSNIVKDLFFKQYHYKTIKCAIILLNNNKLVYKNLLPIISKLSLYIKKNIIDKNIVNSCSAVHALVDSAPELFDSVLILSLLNYLQDQLAEPQNYIFLKPNDVKVMLKTLLSLINYDFLDVSSIKQTSFGLLRKCISKIQEFKTSTVIEEEKVLVTMMKILPELATLNIKYGNRDFNFVDLELLNWDETKENKLKPLNEVDKIDETYNIVREEVICNKNIFLDRIEVFRAVFDRVQFYNDLNKLKNPQKLLKNIISFKKYIDWSDMIVSACNCRQRYQYLEFMFDKEYLLESIHENYIEIFLTKIEDDEKTLLYFTKICILREMNKFLIRLYLLNIENRNSLANKRREIILQKINSLGA